MKFLVIGDKGSMGRRRTQHLTSSGYETRGWDITDGTKMPVGDYDGIFVCTPPDQHEQYMNFKVPTFVEASILPYQPTNSEFIYPSCTMRFHPKVKELASGYRKPLAFTYHVGNYLPDWHPQEDYTIKYFSKKNTGGAREIVPYETNWMTFIWGPCEPISSEYFKLSELKIDANDYYRFSLGFDGNVIGNITIETLRRPRCRELEFIYEGNYQKIDMDAVDWEQIYEDETECFIQAIRGGKYPYSVQEDLWNIKLLAEIEFGISYHEFDIK